MKLIRRKNLLTVLVQGDFDLSQCPFLKEEISREMAANGVNRIIFDLAECTFIDSSGLGLILFFYKQTAPDGGGVAVKNLPSELMRFFTMAGLEKIIAITLLQEVENVGK